MPVNEDGSPLPEKIDHYRIKDKLGEGGMGVVYAAEDERLGRTVALKMLRDAACDKSARERLWREARVAASISHPNVCRLYEVGQHQGELFLAMELLEGESLAARIARGPLPIADALPIMLSILEALDALHLQGVIHRDLKPSNVFLASVGIKLLDFGLAQRADSYADRTETQLSLAGVLVGTPRYMAPERLQGRTADTRADIFAAGAVLFEVLIGKPVFSGATVMEVMHAVMYEQTPVLGGSPAIAAADRIIHRAMAKNPDERYPNARAMADDIRATLQLADSGETIRARPMTRLIVLPFRILRSDPETDFLAFSLADAITISLSGLESLLVRSTLSAARFGGDMPDLRALAEQVDVDIVLAGTLLRAGDQLRVNAQLVEAPGGAVLWSLTSQVPLGDVFQLQDALAQRIVGSLALPLSARDQRLLQHDVPATAKAYEFYLRANKLGYDPKQWAVTRDLYLQCLEEDPSYAPAWARLGRIYRVLGMYTERNSQELYRQAESAFKRALELNPQLPLAHNLYTYLEVELGGAREAMLRLLERAQGRAGDPELFAGLVQACRYCGLLEDSVAAHNEARRLDPEIRTSVAHSYLMLGDFTRAIETNVEDPPTLNALALQLAGRQTEAIDFLRRLADASLPLVHRLYIKAVRALLEEDRPAAMEATFLLSARWKPRDPCALFYLARLLAKTGETQRALGTLEGSVEGGYYPFRFLARDPWLDPLRGESKFAEILRRAENRYRDAVAAFVKAGGDRVLSVGRPGPLPS